MKTIALFDDHGWKEDSDYPHESWQDEVAQEYTMLGYAPWLLAKHETDGVEVEVIPDAQEEEPGPEFIESHEYRFPREHWMAEVSELNTRLGYGVWLKHQVEAELEA